MNPTQDKTAEIEYQDLLKKDLPDETFDEEVYTDFFKLCALEKCRAGYILDAGCGAGNFGRRLALKGHQVLGVDISAHMVEKANSFLTRNFKAVKGDLEDKNLFKEDTFDVIFAGQVLHHFPDVNKVIQNCFYWLKRGGFFIAIEPNGSNPINKAGRLIGLMLSRNKKWARYIATPNEVSLSHKRLIKILEKNNFKIQFLKTYSIFFQINLRHIKSVFLKALINLRDCFYWLTWKTMPPAYRGRTMIIRAVK